MSRTQDAKRRTYATVTENRQRLMQLWLAQKGKCFYCDQPASLDGFYYGDKFFAPDIRECQASRDHIIPLCRDGSDGIENQLMACRECNESKGSLTGEEYLYVRLWGCDAKALAAYANYQYQRSKMETVVEAIYAAISDIAAYEHLIGKKRHSSTRGSMKSLQTERLHVIIREIECLSPYEKRVAVFAVLKRAVKHTKIPRIHPNRLKRLI